MALDYLIIFGYDATFPLQQLSKNIQENNRKITFVFILFSLVELTGIEPVTSAVQGRRSPS